MSSEFKFLRQMLDSARKCLFLTKFGARRIAEIIPESCILARTPFAEQYTAAVQRFINNTSIIFAYNDFEENTQADITNVFRPILRPHPASLWPTV